MAARRTLVTVSWSLQRAEHGEQVPWMGVTLAAMLGQIGLPGGGFGLGYGSVQGVGAPFYGGWGYGWGWGGHGPWGPRGFRPGGGRPGFVGGGLHGGGGFSGGFHGGGGHGR
jgi:hypothetical protein